MPEYRAVIKGPVNSAIFRAQSYGFVVLQILQSGDSTRNNTILLLRHDDAMQSVNWFANGPKAPPFPDGTLLYYKDDDTGMEIKKTWIAKKGWTMDDDLDGLEETPLKTYDTQDFVFEVLPSRIAQKNKFVVRIYRKTQNGHELRWSNVVYDSDPEIAVLVGARNAIGDGDITSADLERLRDVIREMRYQPQPKRGVKMDDDLDGLGAFHPWSVSTLVPALHGKPRYIYFDDFSDALSYARDRVRKGKRLREGGKAYFVLGHAEDPNGVVAYRVFRAFKRAEQRPGHAHYVDKPEFVIVQEAVGTKPDGATEWKVLWHHSIEILDTETEKARKSLPPRVRGDAEDHAAYRLARLREQGVKGTLVRKRDGSLAIKLPDGTIEDV